MAGLRKLPGTPPELGMYEISGSLDGVVPGRRTVGDLHVRRLVGGTGEGLAPLSAFGDLRVLTLEAVRDVDLRPLNGLQLERLQLEDVSGVDLAQLDLRDSLQSLAFIDMDEGCRVPSRLELPRTLQGLFISERGRGRTGRQTQALIEAVDWSELPALKAFDVHLQELGRVPEIDLGFLGELPQLEILWVTGLRHNGSRPSPLEPPFDGLSRKLRRVTFQAEDPTATREAFKRHLAVPDHEELKLSVRRPPVPAPPSWQIRAPARDGGEWHTYGSLADHVGLTSDKTEHDALRAARKTLKEADPQLLRRLDFDPEAGGTGIMARTREDLVSALAILGIAP